MPTRHHLTGREEIDDIDDLFSGYVCHNSDLLAVRRLLERAARAALGPNVLRARWSPASRTGMSLVFLDRHPACSVEGATAAQELYERTSLRQGEGKRRQQGTMA